MARFSRIDPQIRASRLILANRFRVPELNPFLRISAKNCECQVWGDSHELLARYENSFFVFCDLPSRPWRSLPLTWVIHMANRRPAHNTPIHMDLVSCQRKADKKSMSIGVSWARLQVTMWITHVGGLVAQCSATPATVAATPPCSATPFQTQISVRHLPAQGGGRCDTKIFRECSATPVLHLQNAIKSRK